MSVTEPTETINCLLCGGAQLYPSHRYRNHLVHEHGVIFGVEFIIQASIHKQTHLKLPKIQTPAGSSNSSSESEDGSCQATIHVLCSKCSFQQISIKIEMDNDEPGINKDNPSPVSDFKSDNMVDCWTCPLCPMVYKRRYHFDYHLSSAHQLLPEEVSSTWRVSLTKEQFDEKQHDAAISKVKIEPMCDGDAGSVLESSGDRGDISKWGLNAFSSMFLCKFCGEQFKRDINLVVHIKLVHKNEPKNLVTEHLAQVPQCKLDGCVYQCKICGNKFNTSTSFMRHARDVHGLTLKEYHQDHGSAEVVSGVFLCKLCDKKIKHTRNIITAHMKMVHQISWQEYQNRFQQVSNQEGIDSSIGSQETLPPLVLFECLLCSSKVKLKKQHLDKVHHIDEDVYEAFLEKGKGGVDPMEIAGAITCKMCQKLCMDLSRHLKVAHKGIMSLEEYALVPQFELEGNLWQDPTYLRCYFMCEESFKKGIDLQAHLNLKHSEVDQEEFAKAMTAAVEEIAFKKRSNLNIWCEICDSTLSGRSSFWSHITRKHQMNIQEYESEFGKVKDSATPFQCKICLKNLKHQRSSINTHLKGVHSMTWAEYLTFVSEDEAGLAPTLPTPDKLAQCKLCNSCVKGLKRHVKDTHSMTMKAYDEVDYIGVKSEIIEPSFKELSIPKIEESQTQLDGKETSKRNVRDASKVCDDAPTKIDVRDKTIKECRKCQSNFPTRKLFIEHCQVIHGMKFKLKSGETLPPPVNRNSTSELPVPKRIKLDL